MRGAGAGGHLRASADPPAGSLPMTLRITIAVLASLLASPVPPLSAQDLPQEPGAERIPPRLYGYGAGASARPGVSRYRLPSVSPWSREPEWRAEPSPAPVGTTYRTLCVRLCDGYYFPISAAAPGGSLSRDADRCSASCGAEARLFYHPNPGGSAETMVDLTGMAYSALPNAFRYRRMLVEGCSCRPQPWSEAEAERHRGYAQDRPAVADAPAESAAPRRAGGDAPGLVAGEQPEPIDRSGLERARLDARVPWSPARNAWELASPEPYVSGPPRDARSYYLWPGGPKRPR
jgi:hypothetical protein